MGESSNQTNTNPNSRELPSEIENVYLVPGKTL